MDSESALGSIIEVAIAIAGFSGIVAAVGRRGAGHWTEADQLRLRILLTASGAALVFAFLPFVLADLIDRELLWRIASGLLAIYTVAISAYRLHQASQSGIGEAVGFRLWRLVLQGVVVLMLFGNAFIWGIPSLYVAGVLWGVFVAFMTFVRLLLDSWRHEPEGVPPDA